MTADIWLYILNLWKKPPKIPENKTKQSKADKHLQ